MSDREIARLVARMNMEVFLRTAQGLTTLLPDRDFTTMIVHRAIATANLAHLDIDDSGLAYASLEKAPPDSLRRPISVRALALSLDLPFETVRRRVTRLVASGHCAKVQGGVIVPAASLEGPDAEEALIGNLRNLRRLFRRLDQMGFDFEGSRLDDGVPNGGTPREPTHPA